MSGAVVETRAETRAAAGAPPVGLVLSGGGARGAYQVGVLRGLLELGASIDMVAGASIGALNGAVLLGAPTLAEGVQRLEQVWRTLARETPLKLRLPYLQLLASAGLTLSVPLPGGAPALMGWLQKLAGLSGLGAVGAMGAIADAPALLSDGPLKELLNEYLDFHALVRGGRPLYVSIYESLGGVHDALRCALAETGLADTPPSRFVHVQSLSPEEGKSALLASAALPLLYEAQQVGAQGDGVRYSDGGQGGWQKAQGNTPIQPLLDAGCRQVIVTHLSDGALWSRHDFPEATVLEIRPGAAIAPDTGLLGGVKATLGFDAGSIERLMTQGYEDTLRCMGRVMQAVQARQALRESEAAVQASLARGAAADATLDAAMQRLGQGRPGQA